MTDWATLRALAEKATDGEWRLDEHEPKFDWFGNITTYLPRIAGEVQRIVTITCQRKTPNARADAEYIAAANPSAILGFLAELEAMRGQLAAILEHCDVRYVDCSGPVQLTYHYCAICGRNRDDVPIEQPIEHAGDCPLAIRSAQQQETP